MIIIFTTLWIPSTRAKQEIMDSIGTPCLQNDKRGESSKNE